MSQASAIVRVAPLSTAITVATARAELQASRDRVLQHLAAVQREVKRATNWRAVARKHPVAAAIGAVAVGLLVARIFSRR